VAVCGAVTRGDVRAPFGLDHPSFTLHRHPASAAHRTPVSVVTATLLKNCYPGLQTATRLHATVYERKERNTARLILKGPAV
jgi:hypothetical protein